MILISSLLSTTLLVVILLCVAIYFVPVVRAWLLAQIPSGDNSLQAIKPLEQSVSSLAGKDGIVEQDIANLTRLSEGFIEIVLAFIEHAKLVRLKLDEYNISYKRALVYDPKFGELLGALTQDKRADALDSEVEALQAEFNLCDLYISKLLTRLSVVRGQLTQLNISHLKTEAQTQYNKIVLGIHDVEDLLFVIQEDHREKIEVPQRSRTLKAGNYAGPNRNINTTN